MKRYVYMSCLSVIVPVYNEEDTIYRVLSRVAESKMPVYMSCEFIIVNDGSSDSTDKQIQMFIRQYQPRGTYIVLENNKGKGFALRKGIEHAQGDYIVFQDGDLEYDPEDIGLLVYEAFCNYHDIVYGSRFLDDRRYTAAYAGHKFINKLITRFSNWWSGFKLTDVETCYKLFKSSVLKGLHLRENGFGIETEITAKAIRNGYSIFEVPVAYHGRPYSAHKKIGWKDGIRAFYTVLKYNLETKTYRHPPGRREYTKENSIIQLDTRKIRKNTMLQLHGGNASGYKKTDECKNQPCI